MSIELPRHIAIAMDGNGRWAALRSLPRIIGHEKGLEATRSIIAACVEQKIEVLTLWAFSRENWKRPATEVNFLMDLFLKSLQKETTELCENNVRLRVLGEKKDLSLQLQEMIKTAENTTKENTGLQLNIAWNYGGRWDIVQAVQNISKEVLTNKIKPEDITETVFSSYLTLADFPEPDLFIRTSGEQRMSNYFLWQFAYTELYFSELLWPDFQKEAFNMALTAYANRQRRFGDIKETTHG